MANPFEKKILKQALLEWRADARRPLDKVLNETFREHRVGQQQRASLGEAAFLAVRVWPWALEGVAGTLPSKPAKLRAFDMFLDEVLTQEPRKLFERHERAKPKFESHAREHLMRVHGLPASLLASWPSEPGFELALHDYLHASFEQAPFCVRVNTLKTTRETVLERWSSHGARASVWSPDGIVFENRVPLQDDPLFLEGEVEVQDEHSQLIGHFLGVKPGMKILDLCAGAGGKTLHLAALMENKGEIHAHDIARDKLRKLSERAKRAGVSCVKTLEKVPEKGAADYDLVLVDAPCSSLGTLRRNPDRILKWSDKDARALAQLQSELILKGLSHVKSGGVFAYATCTVRPPENLEKMNTLMSEVGRGWSPRPLGAVVSRGLRDRLLTNPALRLAGQEFSEDSHWIQWGPELRRGDEGRLSGALFGDGFFLALYNKE